MKQAVIFYNIIHEREEQWSTQVEAWITAFRKVGVKLIPVSNAQAFPYLKANKRYFKFCLFWDKDYYLAEAIESMGLPLFNKAYTIRVCDDKALTFLRLKDNRVNTPKTVVLPFVCGQNVCDYYPAVQALVMEAGIKFPYVVKERFGSTAEQVYLVKNEKEMKSLLRIVGTKQLLVQEFLRASEGKDYRVNVVGNKAITIVERINRRDFSSNPNAGGILTNVIKPDKRILKLAVKAAQAVDADYCGVDIMLDDFGNPLVTSVNSNARTLAVEAATGVYLTYYAAKYIKKKYKL